MKKWNGKSFLGGAVSAALALSLIGPAAATIVSKTAQLNYNDIKISINGAAITPTDANGNAVVPFAIDGTTYLPIRAVASALDLDVNWDSSTKTVLLTTPEEEAPIYITRTGKHYHTDPHCNGGTYWEAPLRSALGMGLTPCEKCIG